LDLKINVINDYSILILQDVQMIGDSTIVSIDLYNFFHAVVIDLKRIVGTVSGSGIV